MAFGIRVLVIYMFFFIYESREEVADNFGVIYGENIADDTHYAYYCMMYNPRFRKIPKLKEESEKHLLTDMSFSYLCEEPEKKPEVKGKAVAISRGNCTFSEKAKLVQQYGGDVALIISKIGLSEPNANSTDDYQEVNITVAMIAQSDFNEMKQTLGDNIHVQFYAPGAPTLDHNLILIWLMAVGTVMAGALWSGHVKHQQMLRSKKRQRSASVQQNGTEEVNEPEEQETFDVSPKIVIIFVVLMCGMLISLYFLYDYLVYVIIGLFALASSAALYSCLKPLVFRVVTSGMYRIPANPIPILSSQPEIRQIGLASVCLAIGIWWAVERNKSYAWILQDILGIFFCIHMMKTVRLPNFKACFILLVLLFFYDIFFVFITPLFTKSGQSVMVDVATGHSSSSGEMLPMVLKVPRFNNSVLSMCMLPYSLLGFGDILVPGLLVSFCYGFDLKVESKRCYFIGTVIAYGVGLLLTFLALALMTSGQPALLYLVPCTLLTTLVTGWMRGELRHLWQGELRQKYPIQNVSAAAGASANITSDNTNNPDVVIPENIPTSDAEVSSHSSGDEQQLLIEKR